MNDVKDLLYLIRYDGEKGVVTTQVSAVLVHLWMKIPHPLPGGGTITHFDHVFPNARFLGDNADGFDTPTWNREIKRYETPVLPADAVPLVIETEKLDDLGKKKRLWHFNANGAKYDTPPPTPPSSTTTNDPNISILNLKKPIRPKNRVAVENNQE